MPYVITACVVFVIYGIMFNIAKQTGLVTAPKAKDDHAFFWCILGVLALFWPISITIGLLLGFIWLGSQFTDRIAQAIIKHVKGNKDAS